MTMIKELVSYYKELNDIEEQIKNLTDIKHTRAKIIAIELLNDRGITIKEYERESYHPQPKEVVDEIKKLIIEKTLKGEY